MSITPLLFSVRSRLFLLAACLAAWAVSAPAQTRLVSDLYSAAVPVSDTGAGAGARSEGFRRALEQVLVKLSGTREIGQAPEAAPILDRAPAYALRFSYREKRPDEVDRRREQAEPRPVAELHVEFDGAALEKAMLNAGLPVWSANRPATLLWLGVDTGRDRFVLAEDDDSAVRSTLMELAAARGVPLILPLMDLEDRRRVEFADIRGGFNENLVEAAGRYNVPVVMTGWLRKLSADRWSVEWSVHRDNTSSGWREWGAGLEEVLQAGVDGLADILAARYAVSAMPGGALRDVVLAVDGLETLDSYASVLKTLEAFVFVDQVTPVRVSRDRVDFRVRMRGQVQELERALTLSNKLRPRTSDQGGRPNTVPSGPFSRDPEASGGGDADLYYSLRS